MTFSQRATLFTSAGFRAIEMGGGDVPVLQAFFNANPAYYLIVSGQPAKHDEAHEEVHGALPDGWPHTKKWIIGFTDEANSLIGMANVVSDLLAPKVWHIGFFLVPTALHGSGAAQSLYRALEGWMCTHGATWLRLGVVEGNVQGEGFWNAQGYVEVRKRTGIPFGKRINTVSVRVKALGDGDIAAYLQMVPRDLPD